MLRKIFAIIAFIIVFKLLSVLGEKGIYFLIGYLQPISAEFLHNLIAGIQFLKLISIYIAYRVAKSLWVK